MKISHLVNFSMQFLTTAVETLSRRIALSGLMSRGAAEKAIKQGLVSVEGRIVTTGSEKVPDTSQVLVNGSIVPSPPPTPPLWGLIKPRGVFCEYMRERDKIFLPDLLDRWERRKVRNIGPRGLSELDSSSLSSKHFIVVNRIPAMCSGLVLLTTDGNFSRKLIEPESKILTTFRVRVGNLTDTQIADIRQWKAGIRAASIDYGPVFIDVEKRTPTQTWLKVRLVDGGKSGKSLSDLFFFRAGIRVNRINCFAFGPYTIGDVPEGQVLPLPIHESISHLLPKREIKPVLVKSFHSTHR